MPDRLNRHDHPGDSDYVFWGELREVAGGLTAHFRNILRWMIGLGILLLLILVALGSLQLSKQNASTRNGQLAVCAIVDYAETQATLIHQRIPLSPPEQKQNLVNSSAQLHQLAQRMRSTGIKCS
jgi:hypothetical protein